MFKPSLKSWEARGPQVPVGQQQPVLICCNDAEQRRKHEAAPCWKCLCSKREQVPFQIQTITASRPEETFNLEAPLSCPLAVPGTEGDLQPLPGHAAPAGAGALGTDRGEQVSDASLLCFLIFQRSQ